jgi:hypothetical protein
VRETAKEIRAPGRSPDALSFAVHAHSIYYSLLALLLPLFSHSHCLAPPLQWREEKRREEKRREEKIRSKK